MTDAPALCPECGAPRKSPQIACTRCGAAGIVAATGDEPAGQDRPLNAARAWRLALHATIAFVLASQVTQWLWIAVRGASVFSLARAAFTLAAATYAGVRLARRDEAALVVWGWVMNASVVVMAMTFAGAMRWTRLGSFDIALSAWAWTTVLAYAAVLRGARRVVLRDPLR